MEYSIGIDLGGTRVKIGIMVKNEFVAFSSFPSFRDSNMDYNMNLIKQKINEIIERNDLSANDIKIIGLAFAGIVDCENAKVISCRGKFTDSIGFDFKKWAIENFGVPIFMDNDSRMACWGEMLQGVARDYSNVVMVTLGTGIGTGVAIDGELLIGKHFQAGCMGGHFSIKPNGLQCYCGNRGCIEIEASIDVLASMAQQHEDYRKSALSTLDKIEFEHIFKFAQEGDHVAVDLTNYCMELWSCGLISYIHAFDPEIIILGGGVTKSADRIFPFLQDRVRKHTWTPWGEVIVSPSELNDKAAVLGVIERGSKHLATTLSKKQPY